MTKDLLRKKLGKYTKEQIIDGLALVKHWKGFDVNHLVRTIEHIIDGENQERERKEIEQQIENIKKYKDEYNSLLEKYKTQGLLSLSAQEAERLSELMTMLFGIK